MILLSSILVHIYDSETNIYLRYDLCLWGKKNQDGEQVQIESEIIKDRESNQHIELSGKL